MQFLLAFKKQLFFQLFTPLFHDLFVLSNKFYLITHRDKTQTTVAKQDEIFLNLYDNCVVRKRKTLKTCQKSVHGRHKVSFLDEAIVHITLLVCHSCQYE